MPDMYRRHLRADKSHLYKSGIVLRDPLEERTVRTFNNRKELNRWCRRTGWKLMN